MSEQAHTRWEVGQHPAVSRGWIVRPVLFGSRVRVLPEHEGGHVLLMDEDDAHLIAAAPDLLEALQVIVTDCSQIWTAAEFPALAKAREALLRATPSKSGGK